MNGANLAVYAHGDYNRANESEDKFGAEVSQPRQQYGFTRTTCGCERCTAPCRHIPGSLAVEDLVRLWPGKDDIFTWAAEHLRAIVDKTFPTLVPARNMNGHCHWLFEGKCLVHENAPYGCAFFDTHMSQEESKRRSSATIQARHDDAAAKGLYFRVWVHLAERGLIVPSGDRVGLSTELRQIPQTPRGLE